MQPWRVDLQTSHPIALLPTRISLRRRIVVAIHSPLASALEPIGPITQNTSDEIRLPRQATVDNELEVEIQDIRRSQRRPTTTLTHTERMPYACSKQAYDED